MDITQLFVNVYPSGYIYSPDVQPRLLSSGWCTRHIRSQTLCFACTSPYHPLTTSTPSLQPPSEASSSPPPSSLITLGLTWKTDGRRQMSTRQHSHINCPHIPSQFTLVKEAKLGKPSHAWGGVFTAQSVPTLWDSSCRWHLLSVNPMPEHSNMLHVQPLIPSLPPSYEVHFLRTS